jgi:hypothetical protein
MRLIDEFRAAWPDPLEIVDCGVFGDLLWPPYGSREELLADPAFVVTGYTRYAAFERIVGEIRYFAAPIVGGAPSWWRDPDHAARAAAVLAEPDEWEMGRIATVGEAAAFTTSYLACTPLDRIVVSRAVKGPSRI